MKRRFLPATATGLLAVAFTHLPASASACTACMGDPNSKTAGAINAAIFLMLGFIALMLGSLVVFAYYLSRRAATASPGLSADDSTLSDSDSDTHS